MLAITKLYQRPSFEMICGLKSTVHPSATFCSDRVLKGAGHLYIAKIDKRGTVTGPQRRSWVACLSRVSLYCPEDPEDFLAVILFDQKALMGKTGRPQV